MSLDDWLRLIAPVVAGLFALGGSWLGTRFGKATEHQQWLRNQKQEAYVAFINEARDMLIHAMSSERVTAERIEWAKSRIARLRPTEITLLAPEEVRETADGVYGRLLWLSTYLSRETVREPHVVRYCELVEEGLNRLDKLCREDLTGRAEKALSGEHPEGIEEVEGQQPSS